jgi:hypothetical protein
MFRGIKIQNGGPGCRQQVRLARTFAMAKQVLAMLAAGVVSDWHIKIRDSDHGHQVGLDLRIGWYFYAQFLLLCGWLLYVDVQVQASSCGQQVRQESAVRVARKDACFWYEVKDWHLLLGR